jgi:hypothetical protein
VRADAVAAKLEAQRARAEERAIEERRAERRWIDREHGYFQATFDEARETLSPWQVDPPVARADEGPTSYRRRVAEVLQRYISPHHELARFDFRDVDQVDVLSKQLHRAVNDAGFQVGCLMVI